MSTQIITSIPTTEQLHKIFTYEFQLGADHYDQEFSQSNLLNDTVA